MGRGSRTYLDPFALQGSNRVQPSLSYTNLASSFRPQTLRAIFFAFVLKNSGIWILWNMAKVEFSLERVQKTHTIAFQCARVKTEKTQKTQISSLPMLLCAICELSEYVWEILGALVRACTIFKREGKRIPWWNRISKCEKMFEWMATFWAESALILLLTVYPWHSQPTMFSY